MSDDEARWSQVAKTRRVADTLCTAHAAMHDRYVRLSAIIDVTILVLSVVLIAHTFADITFLNSIQVIGLSYGQLLGVLSIGVFALALVQMRYNWKAKAEAHKRSYAVYKDVKRDLTEFLSNDKLDEDALKITLLQYRMATEIGTPIPEHEYLRQKQRHRVKEFISNYIDERPGAWIPLVRARLFWSDTLKSQSKADDSQKDAD